jgi:hypothetical protein
MTVEKNTPNCNIEEISNLKIGDGFITSKNDTENFFIVVGINTVENFSRCINLKNGLEYIFHFGLIVRKINKIIIE